MGSTPGGVHLFETRSVELKAAIRASDEKVAKPVAEIEAMLGRPIGQPE